MATRVPEQLNASDGRRLQDSLSRIYALQDEREYAKQAIAAVVHLIPCDRASYNEVHRDTKRVDIGGSMPEEPQPGLLAMLERYLDEHPAVGHVMQTGYGGAIKISDFVSMQEFTRRPLYNEFYRHLHTRYQLSATLSITPPSILSIALSREHGDFSERDRHVLDVLQPHLVGGHRNARAVTQMRAQLEALEQSAGAAGRGSIGITALGRISWVTPRAQAWLRVYGLTKARPGDRLPEQLQTWVSQQKGGDALRHVARPRSPLVLDREGHQLILQLMDNGDDNVLGLKERVTSVTAEDLAPLGLSRREADVLVWVAAGKTNKEIGEILVISSKTVKKHLEHIFVTLKVETRTAAAARALEELRST